VLKQPAASCGRCVNKHINLALASADHGSEQTLAIGNPLSDFIRSQRSNLKEMKEEEFLARYDEYVKAKGGDAHHDGRSEPKGGSSRPNTSKGDQTEAKHHNVFQNVEGGFKNIVLKFTTLSENCNEAPSFTVDRKGAKIGREASNDISVPSDQRLAAESHATIEYTRGAFHIFDGNCSLFAASVRIGLGTGHSKKWYLDKEARFSAGNSVIESRGLTEEGELELLAVEGPLKGKVMIIAKSGATFGRSSDNQVCIPDKELSRKHTRVDYDEKAKKFVVNDMGSTNGTYIQLVGPYAGRYKLNLNDHILIGRTGFSINRFDFGLSEEMGYRPSMEDACTIVQHLNIGPLCIPDLSPQSFFGVFDGHGGVEASHYLAQHLHVNVAHGLLDEAHNVFQAVDAVAPASLYDGPESALAKLDEVVIAALKTCFLQTDRDFITTSTHPQHGSTGTTALVLGRRLYAANVGDSRTMLCR
jgi:pSer/pThr/pTyr-binding forkhead associated (FHA) protein